MPTLVVFLLAGVAGFVDAAAYLAVGHLFVSHVTGDVNHVGQRLGRGDVGAVLPAAAIFGLFVASILAATAAIEVASRRSIRSPTALALGLEAALVAGLTASGGGLWVVLPLAVCAMGVQTAAVAKHRSRTVRTTYLSGMTTRLAQQLANAALPPLDQNRPSFLRDELGLGTRGDSLRRAVFLVVLVGAFVTGATAGAFAFVHVGFSAFGAPLAVLVACTAACFTAGRER